MFTCAQTICRTSRRMPIARCLAIALGFTLTHAEADDLLERPARPLNYQPMSKSESADSHRRAQPLRATKHASPSAPTRLYVDTCADDNSSHSLRTLAGTANSGDIIDFTQLPMACSTITLDRMKLPSYIEVNQDSLSFVGPTDRRIAIDGERYSSIFRHRGAGTLSISDVSLLNGKYASSDKASGGCIYSAGNVSLTNSTISNCAVTGADSADAYGGGLYVKGDLHMSHSEVNSNDTYAVGYGVGIGAGAFVAGNVQASYSTIAGNTAHKNAYGGAGAAGGLYASGSVELSACTISGNDAVYTAALFIRFLGGIFPTAKIVDSTISGNTTGIAIVSEIPLTLTSSTVAFNRSTGNYAAGIFTSVPTLTLQSTIVADNTSHGQPYDIGGGVSFNTIGGSKNFVGIASIPTPFDTIGGCPELDPLVDNGGPTRTHALRHTSLAIDRGDPNGLTTDQRGAARVAGSFADIGAFERHGELDERISVSGFDGLCDQ